MVWTATDRFEAAIAEAVADPAVDTPLPFEGVSLAGTVVTRDPTPAELDAGTTGVTPADFAIAEYGSVVLRPDGTGTEPVSLYRSIWLSADGFLASE